MSLVTPPVKKINITCPYLAELINRNLPGVLMSLYIMHTCNQVKVMHSGMADNNAIRSIHIWKTSNSWSHVLTLKTLTHTQVRHSNFISITHIKLSTLTDNHIKLLFHGHFIRIFNQYLK